MKKAVLLFGIAIMAACCLIAKDAGKDTVLKQESLQLEETKRMSENTAEEETAPLLLDQNELYAFSTLDGEEQQLYVDILSTILRFETEVTLNTTSAEKLDKVFQCVLMDHPEIFYIDGYKYTEYTVGEEIKRLTFSGNYLYAKEEADKRTEQINQSVRDMLSGIDKKATEYEKVKYVYETIIDRTEYDLSAADNQNICSVFIGGRSVCQGYAKATQYLLRELGIASGMVIGTVKNGEGHAWNIVRIDGEWYYVDTTWGDAYYRLNPDNAITVGNETPSINYDYLCVTTAQLKQTHTIESIVPLPECTSMEANYYVREGAYFTEYDEEKIKSLFERAQREKRETVTVKCENDRIYEELYEKLILEQKVFLFLDDIRGTVAYTNCKEQRSISFWM